jgi:mannose-1-phosphate guanylyltransferase / mannose-6-phosphate isomerase
MKIIILAGGSGTRLWPLSRKSFPKQFLKLQGDKSLLQLTAERFLDVVAREDIIVITNKDYEFHVRSDLAWLTHIILEPVGRNTAPAIALAMSYCTEELGCLEDEVIFVSPSDHIIEPRDTFSAYLRLSDQVAKCGNIVTFGIKPDRPETGYGYIRANMLKPAVAGQGAYKVEDFVEKPDLDTAKAYLADGNYYWNSGMFAFTIATMREEFARYMPEIRTRLDLGFAGMTDRFEEMPSISIDYAVMEKSAIVAAIPAELYWNDIGSWDSLFGTSGQSERSRESRDNLIEIDSEDTLVVGGRRLIATVGLKDCVIVDTDDALLVAQKGSGQKIKTVLERLTQSRRKEALDHVTTQRPWGSFTNLLEADGYKVKKIVVNPGQRLSLQYHKHRSEHWTVVKGQAKVTLMEEEAIYKENDMIHIPVLAKHRVENCDLTPLELIEVQYGDYLGEDDIVRIEDIYGRAGEEAV